MDEIEYMVLKTLEMKGGARVGDLEEIFPKIDILQIIAELVVDGYVRLLAPECETYYYEEIATPTEKGKSAL